MFLFIMKLGEVGDDLELVGVHQSVIKISKDDYESLPSYMKVLASWEVRKFPLCLFWCTVLHIASSFHLNRCSKSVHVAFSTYFICRLPNMYGWLHVVREKPWDISDPLEILKSLITKLFRTYSFIQLLVEKFRTGQCEFFGKFFLCRAGNLRLQTM